MTTMVMITGLDSGTMMRMNIQSVLAPSILAASSRSLGIVKKKLPEQENSEGAAAEPVGNDQGIVGIQPAECFEQQRMSE